MLSTNYTQCEIRIPSKQKIITAILLYCSITWNVVKSVVFNVAYIDNPYGQTLT